MTEPKTRIHFFFLGKKIADRMLLNVPGVGDEVRLSEDAFYVVKRRVWALDEDKYYERCNIELTATD